jgi:DNA-binding response OmpR family regulator
MKPKVLWIEDDYYNYQSLFWPLEQKGVIIDHALSASEGYKKAKNWKDYDLIVVDIILPLTKDSNPIDEEVHKWEKEDYLGIGLVKWLRNGIKVKSPIVILSVIDDPVENYNLQNLHIDDNLSKRGLLPSTLTERIKPMLNISN